MKKILLIITLLISIIGFSQAPKYPIPQSVANSDSAIGISNALQTRHGFVNGVYVDTTAANLQHIRQYAGAQIFTTGEGLPNDVFTNVLWLRNSTATAWGKISSNISSFNVINDSTLVICFSNGVCDTLSINLNISINNIYNNSIVNITLINGDSCAVFFTGGGIPTDTVCFDFVICNYYFLDNTHFVACPCADTSMPVPICDTVIVPQQNLYIFQNVLTTLGAGLIEGGGNAVHDGFMDGGYFKQRFYTRIIQNYGYEFRQYQNWNNSSGIASFGNSTNSTVRYGMNWADSTWRTAEQGGFVPGPNYPFRGLWFGGNGTYQIGQPAGYLIADDIRRPSNGIYFHEDTSGAAFDLYAIPWQTSGSGIGTTSNSITNSKVITGYTNKNIQFQGYPNTRHDGAPTNVLYTDANGNVLTDTLSGGSVTVINDTTLIICSFGTYLCDTFYSTSGTVNIYNSDGTLLADRFVSGDGKELYIDALKDFNVTADDGTGRNMQFFMNGSGTGTERGFFTHNNNTQSESGWQTIARNVNDTLHEMRMWSSRSIPDLAWGGASGNTLRLRPDLFRLEISNATNFQISGMLTTTDTTWKPIVYNPADSSVKYLTNWPNLGLDSIRAYNGLTAAGSDSVKLGGTLTENTTINGNSDTLSLISLAKLKIVADTLKIKGKTDSITAPTTLAVWRGDTLMKARNGAARTLALIVATQPASGDGINSTNLDSYTIPANTFAVVGDAMVIEYNGNTDSTAGGVVLSVSFNSGTRATASLTSGDWSIIARYIYNSGTTFNASIKFEISIFCNGQVVYITNGSFSGNDLTSTMGSLLNVGVAPVGTNVFTYFGKFDFFPAN